MENSGYIEIRIKGKIGKLDLKPDTYDIREIKTILEQTENLLFPYDKSKRPLITYELSEGSVVHRFRTTLQFIIGFNALLGQIALSNNIDFLDAPTAKAIEIFQDTAKKKDYELAIKTSVAQSSELKLTQKTNFYRTETLWADAEFYLYGKITNAGGKDKANIHISVDDMGIVKIETPIDELEKVEHNILYKIAGVHAKGKQNIQTGELDKSSLKFINFLEYTPTYDAQYISSLRKKATSSWKDVPDVDVWLNNIRGSYET